MSSRPSSADASRALLAQRLISLTDLTSLNESDDAASVQALSLVVFPYRALLAGDASAGLGLVRGCREACAERALLKVILETGQLVSTDNIRLAAEIAIDGGAHFLKTSTGKTQPAATPEAAAVLLDVIAAAGRRGRSIGFKASGGIRTIGDATVYLTLYEQRFGSGSASPGNFRVGTSALFKELLAAAAMS